MQDGVRVGSVSGLVPKPVRELLQSHRVSPSPERDLVRFLTESSEEYPIHVHTLRGVIEARWESDWVLASRTQLDLMNNRVRVQRVVADKDHEDRILRDFAKIGEGLIVDLENGRLLRLADISGWYAAGLLEEKAPLEGPAETGELLYEPEFVEAAADMESYAPVASRKQEPKVMEQGFAVTSEPFEVSLSFFNDKKIGFPASQRASYLNDLLLKVHSQDTTFTESQLLFRATLARTPSPERIQIKGACLWNGSWFEIGDDFSKYFEHLHSLRSALLRKGRCKKILSETAFRLLSEKDESSAETLIKEQMDRLDLREEQALWEAGEYCRRFYKSFVQHRTEVLLAGADAWCLVPLDLRKWGELFWEVQSAFGGDLFHWLQWQIKDVESTTVFSQLRPLFVRLNEKGIELCFNQRNVQNARLRVRVRAEEGQEAGWFEVHPEVFWEGKPVPDTEWRRILENQGLLEQADGLWVLDEASLNTLEYLKDLLPGSSKRPGAVPDRLTRIPRPQILDWAQLRRLGATLELSDENERLVQKLLQFEKIESRPIPEKFRGSLRDYQKEGYDWISFLYEHRLGGCLADDMGLGKTVQAIAFLGGLEEGKIRPVWKASASRPHLVVMPSTLVFKWKQEFDRFYPELHVREFSGADRQKSFEGTRVMLTTYDLLRQDRDFFERQRFHTIIFDEAQFLKNLFAQRTVIARQLKADFVLTLTGTPLENHIGEYYSILDLSLPGLLGKYEEFRRLEKSGHWERLKKRAAPFVLRRTKDNTLKELPPKTENEIMLSMTPRQKALYQKVVSQVRRKVADAFQQKASSQASLSALTAILRLRQVCVSPRLLDPKAHERSPKIDYLLNKLSELVLEEHSAVVFSQFTAFLDVLEEELRREKLDYFRMDGSTPAGKRKALINAFQCGAGAPIFLISLKTGGVGLNLTRASYVFHLDPWWNPAVENQASDRVHRIGQKKNVFVTRLLMRHTVEEKMILLKKKKAALYRQVLDPAKNAPPREGLLTKEDFDFLLS